MILEFINFTQYPLQKKIFEKILQIVKTKEKIKDNNFISLVLVGEKRIRDINKRYREKNQVTAVLSFTFLDIQRPNRQEAQFIESKEVPRSLGEIFLCPTKIKRQAEKLGQVFEKYLIETFVHGLLHLLGYQHRNTSTTKKMKKREKEIVNLCLGNRDLTKLIKKNKI